MANKVPLPNLTLSSSQKSELDNYASDRNGVKELIDLHDDDSAIFAAFSAASLHTDSKDISTTAGLLNAVLLRETDLTKRTELASYGAGIAANMSDFHDGHKSDTQGYGRGGRMYARYGSMPSISADDFSHNETNPIGLKLRVLAEYGADMNKAVMETHDPKLIQRNALILLDSGQKMNSAAAQRVLDTMGKDLFPKGMGDEAGRDRYQLVMECFGAGARMKEPAIGHYDQWSSYTRSGAGAHDFELKDPLQVAFYYRRLQGDSPDYFGQLLTSHQTDHAGLLHLASLKEQPQDGFTYLRAHGFDMDTLDTNGKTVISRVAGQTSANQYELNHFENVVRAAKEAGADLTLRDASGKTPQEHHQAITSEIETARQKEQSNSVNTLFTSTAPSTFKVER